MILMLNEAREGDCFHCGSTVDIRFLIVQREQGLPPLGQASLTSRTGKTTFLRLCDTCLAAIDRQRAELAAGQAPAATLENILDEPQHSSWDGNGNPVEQP